jgi:hypothetical protein
LPGIPADPGPHTAGPFPEHIATHYLSLSIGELTAEQLRHYQRLWPRIEALVTAHAADADTSRLIIEGSGVLPERVATLKTQHTAAVWLTASAGVLRDRIYSASRFYQRTAEQMGMVEKFLGRTDRHNQAHPRCRQQPRVRQRRYQRGASNRRIDKAMPPGHRLITSTDITTPEPVKFPPPPCTRSREHMRFAERFVGSDRDAVVLFPFGEDLE